MSSVRERHADRELVPGVRTCILKGVSGITSVNELQAYVWGGRLESICFEAGRQNAVVKFLTPEACQKYFRETANGIPLPLSTGKEALITVESWGGTAINQRCSEEVYRGRCIPLRSGPGCR